MKLNLVAPFNMLSYGYVSTYFARELLTRQVDLRLVKIGQYNPDQLFKFPEELHSPFHHEANCLKIWHQHDLGGFYGRGLSIGFPIFELEEFTKHELNSLKYPDKLIVCSQWAKNVLSSYIDKDISVVPLGYDEHLFRPVSLPSANTTIFGNFGKWEVRKGHDVLFKAFDLAFEKTDNVRLMLMPGSVFNTDRDRDAITHAHRSMKLRDRVTILPSVVSHEKVYSFMRMVTCGVFPSRAEGWNLGALELLACGRDIIITNVTGHTEFCHNEKSHLIEMRSGKEKAYDGKYFNGDFSWHRISNDEIDQLVCHMRAIHEKNRHGELNHTPPDSIKEYTWTKSANKLMRSVL